MSAALPPRPSGLRVLTDEEGSRLDREHPDMPKSLAHCITCKGTKTFRWYANGEPVDYDCNCVDQRIMHRYFQHSGLGLRYQRLAWADLDRPRMDGSALDRVLDYGDEAANNVSTGRGLMLYGTGMGTGKTLMAALLFKAMLSKGIDGHFVQFNEMLDSFTGTWRDPDERAWFTRRVRNTGILVIDDVGKENKGRIEVADAMFDMVLRARHDNDKPTIITTNKTPEEFEILYRSNILSLLSGTSEDIHVKSADYRPLANNRTATEKALGLTRPIVAA